MVYDFRAADVAAGGQGAPVVPVFHRAMVRMLERVHPVGVLNLGGVANVTFIDGDAELIAFDTGPGNALIDDFVRLRTGQPRDDDGRTAAAGKVDEAAVARVLAHPFFAKPPPKSLDRNAFRHWVAEKDGSPTRAPRTAPATLTAITAAAVAQAHHGAAARAGELDRRRRRHAQSDPDADAGGTAWRRSASRPPAPSAGRRMRSRRRPSPISPCARSRACRSRFRPRPASPRPLTGGVLVRKPDGASPPRRG